MAEVLVLGHLLLPLVEKPAEVVETILELGLAVQLLMGLSQERPVEVGMRSRRSTLLLGEAVAVRGVETRRREMWGVMLGGGRQVEVLLGLEETAELAGLERMGLW